MEQNGGGGTKINELMENITNNQLDDKESTMVDSIINDLNNSPPPQQQQQQQQQQPGSPPQQQQMNDQQMQQQMMMQQQQMEQYQQMLQQQQTELEQMKDKKEKKKKEKESDTFEEIIAHIKLPLIVICLSVLLNIDPVNEIFKFGNNPIFFDIETSKFTMLSVIIKSILIGMIFFGVNFAINK
tara:strand:+ start:1107 stop:1658 length:552 start_codon:yes stop_codon:yes gene_type:complete